MASFSSQDQDNSTTTTTSRHSSNSLFVGSFNINSSDLSKEDARAWLAKAGDADIVALGFQVPCVFLCV